MLPAMVLCAGFGTRLRPITNFLPKPLLPVGDRPALVHILDHLREAGFGPVVINTHHRAEAFDGSVPTDVRISLEQATILGTAGGVANARSLLGGGEALVWNGDVLAEPDLGALHRAHRDAVASLDVAATLLAVERRAGEGTLGIGADGCVVRLRGERYGAEVAGGDFLGIQILTERVRAGLPREGCLVGDVYMPELRRGRRVSVAWHRGAWDDIGNPRALLEANFRWLSRRGLDAWVAADAQVAERVELVRSVVCAGASVNGSGVVRDSLVLPAATALAPIARAIAMGDGDLVVA